MWKRPCTLARMGGRVIAVGVLAFALVLACASAAGAATGPKLKVAVRPAVATPGAMVTVSGRVAGRVRGSRLSLRVVLEEKLGARWARRATVKPSRALQFVVRWRPSPAAAGRTLRLRLLRGRRALASSATWRLTVAAPSLPAPGRGLPSSSLSPSPAPGGGPGPARQTMVIAPSTVEAAPGAGSAGVLRLAGDVVVRAGDVLASGIGAAAPYGFLFKATGARSEGGDTVVDVVPATLLEAIPQGQIDESFTFAPADRRRGTRGSGSGIEFRKSLECSAGGTVTIEGSVDLGGPKLDLDADWGFLKLNSVEATASVTTSANASATATGSATCTVGPIKIFETKLAPVTFSVGIPIVLVPKIEIQLDGLGEIDAAVSTSVDASLTAKAGARYEDGDLSPISDLQQSFTYQAPDPQGSAKLTAALSSELEIAAYGVGGPAFNFNAGLEANAEPEAPHPWWSLDAPISFTAGLDIDILDIEAGPITVYEKRFRLAEAAPETYTWSGNVSVSEDLLARGLIYADPERPQLDDAIAGSFSMDVAEEVGVPADAGEQVEAATSGGDIALTPAFYPWWPPGSGVDEDCTWSRAWEDVAFNDLPGMLEIAPFTDDSATGVRDRTRGSVLLFRAEGQVDESLQGFGYQYSETAGKDASCDDPGKSTESRSHEVLSTRAYPFPVRNVPVVRDADGRIFMQDTVTQDVPSEGQGRDLYPLTAFGHGTRTITVDLMGLPPGVPAP